MYVPVSEPENEFTSVHIRSFLSFAAVQFTSRASLSILWMVSGLTRFGGGIYYWRGGEIYTCTAIRDNGSYSVK